MPQSCADRSKGKYLGSESLAKQLCSSIANQPSPNPYLNLSLVEYCWSNGTIPPQDHSITKSIMMNRQYRLSQVGPMRKNLLKRSEIHTAALRRKGCQAKLRFYSYPRTVEKAIVWHEEFEEVCHTSGIYEDGSKVEFLDGFVPFAYKLANINKLTFKQACDELIRKQLQVEALVSQRPPFQSQFCLISDYMQALDFYELRENIRESTPEEVKPILRARQFFGGLSRTTQWTLATCDITSVEEAINYIQEEELIALSYLETGTPPQERRLHSNQMQDTRSWKQLRAVYNRSPASQNRRPPLRPEERQETRQYCDHHRNNTHSTEECRFLNRHSHRKYKRPAAHPRMNSSDKKPRSQETENS
ncbi:hypothetical protein NEHOM01_0983 [Nematocida homosporus]|uniref:uncharacterized protein n=1 Tax=Nematocida homosporus TaxID=1912981 RepID=UPI00221FE2AF|nr:uncharacterized protein NEHOM01_0983 [Nematocida homosporus]KAI5185657.1 hypothetical protein NEHOM01_0983 [Nematocida homosporus]